MLRLIFLSIVAKLASRKKVAVLSAFYHRPHKQTPTLSHRQSREKRRKKGEKKNGHVTVQSEQLVVERTKRKQGLLVVTTSSRSATHESVRNRLIN